MGESTKNGLANQVSSLSDLSELDKSAMYLERVGR